MDSSLDFIVVMEAGPKEISRSKGNTRGRGHKGRGGRASSSTAYLSPTGKNVPPVLNPRDFIVLPWTTYCGALQSASLTMNALSTQCIPQLTQAYGQKAQNHAADAFNFYKENVYQGEYAKDSKVEKAFIEARLADIIGNPTPLSEFYKQLRQRRQDEQHEKLVEMIKAEQEAQGQREEKHRQKSTKESQQKASKILLEGEDTDTPVLVSPIEAVSISINRPSVVAELSPETRPKKEKIKTRGIAKPQSVSSLKDTLILEEERKKVGLSSDDHHVFHSLTGGIFDRGISLDRVKKLLTSSALGCKISTGGSHPGKATAPNGKMWTIPSPWEGPIPHYYRQQLNDFLQSAMDIDPDNVV
jgi:ribosomal protein L15